MPIGTKSGKRTSTKRSRSHKGDTTSSGAADKRAQDLAAGQVSKAMVQQAASTATTNERNAKVADEEDDIGTIVEYSEDIDEAEKPQPLPKAEYEAVIKTAVPKLSKSSGKKYAETVFYIGTDQFPADYPVENAPDGVSIPYRMVSLEDTPKGRWQVRSFCEAIGAKPPKRQVDTSEWIGLVAKVGVDHEKGLDGLPREVITKVSAI